jgi:hypothetical protein
MHGQVGIRHAAHAISSKEFSHSISPNDASAHTAQADYCILFPSACALQPMLALADEIFLMVEANIIGKMMMVTAMLWE